MISRRKRVVAGLVTLISLLGVGSPAMGDAMASTLPQGRLFAGSPVGDRGIRVRASTASHVILELSVPDVQVDQTHLGGQPYVILTAPGLDDSAMPGHPRLPQTGVLIGLPPTGGWSVRVVERERQIVAVPRRVAPAPNSGSSAPGSGALQTFETPSWATDEEVYRADAFYPASPVEVGDSVLLRDLRVVRLELHPVRYNPVRGQLEHIRRLVLEVRFEEPREGISQPPDTWDPILGQAVVNYDVARSWRVPGAGRRVPGAGRRVPGAGRPVGTQVARNPLASISGSFKIEVDADGLYQLTYDELRDAGFPVEAINPENLHLAVGGQEVAIRVELGSDAEFNSGDWILFYGEAAQSRYTRVNIYWLASDHTPGLRMEFRSVTPDVVWNPLLTHWITTHFEENRHYHSLYPEPSGDHWYWDDLGFLQTGCPDAVWRETFDLPQLWPGSHSVTMRIALQAYTFGTHNLKVWVNDHHAGNIVWQGPNRMNGELMFDAAWLRSNHGGPSKLLLENGDCPSLPPASRPPNGMVLNYFEIEHEADYRVTNDVLVLVGEAGNQQYDLGGFSTANLALFDITDPSLPVALVGAEWMNGRLRYQDETGEPRRYLATAQSTIRSPVVYRDIPSNLASPSAGADYLLIGYGEFLPATRRLTNLRAAQGLDVMTVDVQDVYDEFSSGLLDPGAIRDLLAYASAEWQVIPTYVLLVGDGTIDYHDHLGNGWHNFLPAYPANVELRVGPEPAETASDNELDPGGDLPIYQMGRLPVSTFEQTQALITKIVNYETAPSPGFWNRRVLIVADNDDSAGAFTEYGDQFYQSLLEPLLGDRIYLATEPTQPHEYDNDPRDATGLEAARAAIRDRFTAGRLMVTYLGHSSHSQWAQEVLLHRDRVPELQSGRKLPVVLSMTCYTGAFQFPSYSPLDERLVLEPGGGAVAAWGATGAAVATGHQHLAKGFLDAVQSTESATLGAATYAGLLELYNQAPANRDLIDTYVLLGDPAMSLNRFSGTLYNAYLPLGLRGQ